MSCSSEENREEARDKVEERDEESQQHKTQQREEKQREEISCVEDSLSPSERATISHEIHVPNWISWLEQPFRVKTFTTGLILPESTGWSMDAAARGPLNLVGSYVGVALVRIASLDAGCVRIAGCEETVYGLKPSSILTATTAIVGVAAALFMPIVGAVVDHTPHRRLIGQTSAAILVAITGIQMSINESNWFIILCLEAIGGFTLLVHVAAVFSYLPDLSNNYEKDYVHYTASFNIRQFSCQTVFAGLVTLISKLTFVPKDPVGNAIRTSRGASAVAFGISFLLLGYSWTLNFRKRPALRQLAKGESLCTIGFISVYRTTREVFSKLRALKWLLIALLWSPEAGAGVIASIAITFLQVAVELTSMEISITLLILLVSHLPGSIISKYVCNRLNPAISYRLAICAFLVCSSLAAWLTTSAVTAYIFATTWGVSLGWMYPSQKVLFCTLIPKGQEFEFMGIFTFFGHILSWLPTILFTVMNEQGVSIRWGFALLPFFYVFALICTCFMGDYEDAVAMVGKGFTLDTSASRHDACTHTAVTDSNASDSRNCQRFPAPVLPQTDVRVSD